MRPWRGIIAAYGDKVKLYNGDKRILLSTFPRARGKVGIVGGRQRHLPVFLGYCRQGMLDGCAVVTSSPPPSAQKMADMIRACDREAACSACTAPWWGIR